MLTISQQVDKITSTLRVNQNVLHLFIFLRSAMLGLFTYAYDCLRRHILVKLKAYAMSYLRIQF